MAIEPRIPVPEAYDVSTRSGFLPVVSPCGSLSDPYYAPWFDIARNLPNLLMCKRLRTVVDDLPILLCDRITTVPQLREAYSILVFLCHAYVWQEDPAVEVVPPQISIPFLSICKSLELPPVATYAGLVLWNFKTTYNFDQLDRLNNLATQFTFTGASDESWFYLVSVAIEARGGPLIQLGLEAVEHARAKRTSSVAAHLQCLSAGIRDICTSTQRIYDSCDPHFFYHRLRPYLAGSKGVAKLPHGLFFDDGTETIQPVQYSGGSNAQSSLIQFVDIALGVKHHPTVAHCKLSTSTADQMLNGPPTPPIAEETTDEHDFIATMRQYMPGPHRRFLAHFAKVANIRAFVIENYEDKELVASYNACIAGLVRFRDIHLQVANRYIVLQDTEGKRNSYPSSGICKVCGSHGQLSSTNDRDTRQPKSSSNAKGTGGTSLLRFLKQARNETWRSYAGLS